MNGKDSYDNMEKQDTAVRERTAETVKKIDKSEKAVRHYQTFILRLALILIVLWVLLFKIIGITHMPSDDMYPRLDAGDLVMFYRLDKDVQSQDIIVLEKKTPEGKEKMFISRVVAKGGDTVDIDENDNLKVNGNAVVENNIFYRTPAWEGYTEFPVKLAQDECFVLADSREEGSDSRYFGPVSKSEIRGTVITIVRRNKL